MNALKHKRHQLSLLLLLSLAALLLLAGGLPEIRFQPGEPLNLLAWLLARLATENRAGLPEITGAPDLSNNSLALGEGMLWVLTVFFWLMLIFSILYAVISPKFRRDLIRIFAFVLFMVYVLPEIAKNLAEGAGLLGIEGQSGDLILGENTFPQPPPFVQEPPEWLFAAVNLLLVALFCGGIYLLWRSLRPKPSDKAVVVQEVRKALSELETGAELKDVVIACYDKMCQGLGKSRLIQRQNSMTPREFEERLAQAGIVSVNIRQLTRLFEGVRYGAKTPDKVTEHEAIQCLQAILQVYGE